jgi:hypothetical protein
MTMTEVTSYIESLPEPRRSRIGHLHGLILQAAPQLAVKLWDYSGPLIGYGTYHYKSKSGREGDWFILGLANRKSYVSLYSMATRDGEYLVELYSPRLPGTKTGRSCINITKPEQIEDAVILDLARETYEAFKDEALK